MHHACLPLSVALAFGTALATLPAIANDEAEVWRLLVADHSEPRITAFDLGHPDEQWTFDVTGPARLYASPSAGLVVATQTDNDVVSIVETGIALESHGDHADVEVTAPTLSDVVLEGPRPSHVVFHDETIAVTFDRGGYADIVAEADVDDGAIELTRFPLARAHHGFAVPMGDVVVSSVASDAPVEGDALPPRVGIQSFTPAGEPIGEMTTCTDLHGEAFSGRFLAAGCKEGVVAIEDTGEGIRFEMLPYPEEFPDGNTGTLLGVKSMQMFLGNYGPSGVVVIDPTTAPYFTLVELPFRRVDFVLDPAHPQHAFILTEDGTLHRLDMIGATVEASGRVTEPYSMDGHWRDPRPRLAVAGEQVAVTDPRAGLVRLVDAESLAEVGTIAVGGMPYNIVAVGGSGQTH